MAFNLFGPPTKDDIRVGYVDPNLGLVQGVTICQANEYAVKNPGTTFIFRNGNNVIQYLNINEVNNIDPNVLVSTDECGGINQRKECGPPNIQFFGGGGIGAAGNPVVGRDGSLLAVDVVRGGNGYQYPPLVAARDNCNYGSGSTLTAVLGEVVETIESYENESDFEDYEICEDTDVGYGKRYGPNGEELGEWEPRLYTDPGEDPIRNQVQEFEEIVRKLARTPFWSTRKNKPTKITCSDPRVIPSKYDVTDKTHLDYRRLIGEKDPIAWNEFMNSYAISPVSPSNVRGSDFSGKVFTFEWTEEFPTDGEYIFRGLCDNVAQLFVDDLKVADLAVFNAPVRPIQKTLKKGLHNIRVDLLNLPLIDNTQNRPEIQAKTADVNFTVKSVASSTFASTFSIKDLNINVSKPSRTAVNQTISKKVEVGKVYSVEIDIPQSKNITLKIKGNTLQVEDLRSSTPTDLYCTVSNGRFFEVQNGAKKATCKFVVDGPGTIGSSETVISPRSWNENPMGVALTIDAPEPTIPQETKPEQEGRCPPNPIWTTRFPGAKETWYPVQFNGSKSPEGAKEPWSKFFNRYAISPVPPLDTPGSDGGGVLFTNSWDLEIPYDGFYKFAVQRDNTARIFVDGNLAFDVTTSGDDIWKDFINKPKFQRVFISKGRHTIGVELENRKTEAFDQVSQRIFRTKDWQVSTPKTTQKTDVDFTIKAVASSAFSSSFKVSELNVNVSKPSRTAVNQTIPTKVEIGKVYTVEIEVPQSKGITLKVRGNTLEVEDLRSTTARDLFCTISKGRFFDVRNGAKKATCKFVVDETGTSSNLEGLSGGTAKDGVTYDGPPLFAYKDNRWGTFMNNHSVSPIIPGPLSDAGGRKKFTWRGVKFPESGQYDITFLSDSDGILFIGGKEVLRAQQFAENPQTFKVNITQGTYDIVVDNDYPHATPETNTAQYFRDINPTGFAIVIRKNVSVRRDYGKSWDENPMGIGAILIPPPCPRRIKGRGVVTDVIVNDPGNGYLRPIPQDQGYPVTLRLKEVIVENPGINYSGTEQFVNIPNGAVLEPVFGPFGRVESVNVLNPGLGFTEYPEIRLISETGVNASFRPVFEVVRDPIVLPEKLIQVTDLVGLKQTGYVDGRAYYGTVYYDQGVRFAGFYETVGEPVRVYDTLQESITAEVTTPPSAIERQGTDITSNDPRLNIPGTPENLI